MEPIILASASPRRQDFFKLLGLNFICMPAMIDETPPPGLPPQKAAENIALRKVMSLLEKITQDNAPQPPWIFGADTMVVLEGAIFGKAADRDAARLMLEKLSGKRHEVITAIALYNGHQNTTVCRSVVSEVTFAPLGAADIEWYLDSGEWEGVAGAYRLQELGAVLIESIKGSPSGIAGLPLHEFYGMLKDNDYHFGA